LFRNEHYFLQQIEQLDMLKLLRLSKSLLHLLKHNYSIFPNAITATTTNEVKLQRQRKLHFPSRIRGESNNCFAAEKCEAFFASERWKMISFKPVS